MSQAILTLRCLLRALLASLAMETEMQSAIADHFSSDGTDDPEPSRTPIQIYPDISRYINWYISISKLSEMEIEPACTGYLRHYPAIQVPERSDPEWSRHNLDPQPSRGPNHNDHLQSRWLRSTASHKTCVDVCVCFLKMYRLYSSMT